MIMSQPSNILLSGIVGSHAHGLSNAKSDIDRLGIFAFETQVLHTMHRPEETYIAYNSDTVYHEAGKWCRLAANCNPTITELMWIPEHFIESCNDNGRDLISIRSSFLSASRVRRSYLGYASGQLRQIERLHGDFSPIVQQTVAKHARHLLRVCWQGFTLYKTGILPVTVDAPDHFHAFAQKIANGYVDDARKVLSNYEDLFRRTSAALPDTPDIERIDTWLRFLRIRFFRSK